MLFASVETASAFGAKRDDWQRKKVKIFVAICGACLSIVRR
jgi:hypothetical protein